MKMKMKRLAGSPFSDASLMADVFGTRLCVSIN